MREFYLEKAWGGSLSSVTIDDVRTAIKETIGMDAEHGAFWVGTSEDQEYVLEVNNDLMVYGLLAEDHEEEISGQLTSWKEVENLYEFFLAGDFDRVKEVLKGKGQ